MSDRYGVLWAGLSSIGDNSNDSFAMGDNLLVKIGRNELCSLWECKLLVLEFSSIIGVLGFDIPKLLLPFDELEAVGFKNDGNFWPPVEAGALSALELPACLDSGCIVSLRMELESDFLIAASCPRFATMTPDPILVSGPI